MTGACVVSHLYNGIFGGFRRARGIMIYNICHFFFFFSSGEGVLRDTHYSLLSTFILTVVGYVCRNNVRANLRQEMIRVLLVKSRGGKDRSNVASKFSRLLW